MPGTSLFVICALNGIHAADLDGSATDKTVERIVIALTQLTNQVAVGEFDVINAVGTIPRVGLLAKINYGLCRTQWAQLVRRRKSQIASERIDRFCRHALH